jgi:hypothetical protein
MKSSEISGGGDSQPSLDGLPHFHPSKPNEPDLKQLPESTVKAELWLIAVRLSSETRSQINE